MFEVGVLIFPPKCAVYGDFCVVVLDDLFV